MINRWHADDRHAQFTSRYLSGKQDFAVSISLNQVSYNIQGTSSRIDPDYYRTVDLTLKTASTYLVHCPSYLKPNSTIHQW